MDGSSIEEKETGQSTKRPKIFEVNKDFINDLPDSILVHILTFLPLRDAIKTVLLRRFGKLWLSMPVLDLDHCTQCVIPGDGEDCDSAKFMDIIHQVWNHHHYITLEKLRLSFFFMLIFSNDESTFYDDSPGFEDFRKRMIEKEKATAHQIEKLLGYALSRKVKVLDLDFKGCGSVVSLREFYRLPDTFRSNYLTELQLTGCDIRSCANNIYLQALRALSLEEVLLNDKVMAKILLGCPLLEDLSVVDCYGLRKLNCASPLKLKKLMLSLTSRLFISCPHILSLNMLGWIHRATLLNASSLVDASITFSNLFKCKQIRYSDVRRLLLMVRHCQTFTSCGWAILVMTNWKLRNLDCPSFKWKNLKLNLDLTKCHLPGLCYLFKSCLSLETLTISIFPKFDRPLQANEAKWLIGHDFDGESYLETEEVTLPCLKSILIYGLLIVPYTIQMVKFLLKNAPNLQKIEILVKKYSDFSDCVSDDEEDRHISERQDYYTSEQMLEFSHKLTTLPRASSQARIYFDF